MIKRLISLLLITAISITLPSIALGKASSSGPKPIVIGGLVPLTGESGRQWGLPAKRVADYAVTEINKAGGVKGRPLKIVWKNGKCNYQGARNATEALVKQKVPIILGGYCAIETVEAAYITQPKGIVLFSPASSHPEVSLLGDYVFRNYPSDAMQGRILGEYAVKKGFKNVGVLVDFQNEDMAKEFIKAFSNEERKVIQETLTRNVSEIDTVLKKLESLNVDAYFIADAQTEILMHLQELNIKKPYMFDYSLISYIGEVEGATDFFKGTATAYTTNNDQHPKYKKLERYYKRKYKKEFVNPAYTQRVYDAVYVLKDALKAVEDPNDKKAIRDYLGSLKDWQGTAGPLTFDENGDPREGFEIRIFHDGLVSLPEE